MVVSAWKDEVGVLKEKVRKMLTTPPPGEDNILEKLSLIDAVLRLGIGYHFQKEIEDALLQIHQMDEYHGGEDISTIALGFRLLRQRGYNVSSGGATGSVGQWNVGTRGNKEQHLSQISRFSTAQDDRRADMSNNLVIQSDKLDKPGDTTRIGPVCIGDGPNVAGTTRGSVDLPQDWVMETRGLLNLYEASYLSVHGEEILDDALEFTKKHLKCFLVNDDLPTPVGEQVNRALQRPVERNVEKFEQLKYISIYEKLDAHNEVVLKLAKLDFNIVQSMYQQEMRSLTEWWVDLDFATKVPPFFRDRLIDCFFWALGTFPEPELSMSRIIISKFGQCFSVIDDMYDVYGRIDELELFTEAIERWDGSIEHLPDYMKVVFHLLMELLKQLEEETTKEGRPYCIQYVKEAVKRQIRAYITEARWFNQGYVPKFEEHRAVTGVSTCLYMLAYQTVSMMPEATKEVYDWLVADPKILVASADHARLWDDIASHEFEQKRGSVASTVECYMKEYGVSKEEAHDVIKKLIKDDWKYMNKGFMKEVDIPKKILRIFLGYARVMDVLYGDFFDGYNYADTTTKEMMEALLVNPIPV
ncbi:hypothetical protein Tsubulata_024912 [Turnera subulata]|uniref:Uncharacterized protein n=1 Tax=Turnera subulata TaxID=218843 RepID=A0A9Q0FYV9_9ROSI|nr:hypothetical protein Tsubulata_024912 [Turnera subulata]